MKLKSLSLLLGAGLGLAGLAGCDPASGEPVALPDVSVNCASSACTGASGLKSGVINITRSGCAPDQIDLDPVATGNFTTNCGGSGCTGTVSSWVNATTGESITEVSGGFYEVCGWIDLTGAGKSAGDAFAESSESISGASITLTDWSVNYFSRQKTR